VKTPKNASNPITLNPTISKCSLIQLSIDDNDSYPRQV
jgi:hypothetical protein